MMRYALLLSVCMMLTGCDLTRALKRHGEIPLPKKSITYDYKVFNVKQGSIVMLVNGQPREIRIKGGIYLSESDSNLLARSIHDQSIYCDQLKRAIEIHNKEFK